MSLSIAVVSGQLIVVKGVQRTNQSFSLREALHLIGSWTIPRRIYLVRDYSSAGEYKGLVDLGGYAYCRELYYS